MIHHINIILFYLPHLSLLLTDLRPILESAHDPCIECSEWPIDEGEATQAATAMAQIFFEQPRDAVMLIIDSAQFERAVALLPLLRQIAADIPMIVITETDQPDEVWKLMQRTRLQGEWPGVWRFSGEPGKIGLRALEETGDGIDQDAKSRLA
ncbi:MAG: hypothetical protein ETSY2_34640 [Candidatus Entotheonella gemina]|uniref:Uncharacterized protein n=1 Tax=Candidatus Entotheonella gemina TaxID=1429439 RepID=W4LYS0_9BACT|nr:MAG: hypothetical protein ETSY2_34640 [Candidatus Entotheonella gemina]